MSTSNVLKLYHDEYCKKRFERLDLFRELARRYGVRSVLYPGSFVHVTPSFVFPVAVYADTDKRVQRFFRNPDLLPFIASRREYETDPTIQFRAADYQELDEPVASFDLLVSQYAGFVSPSCKRFLRAGGILLVNDSHGDASMARLDPELELTGAVMLRSGRCQIVESSLGQYFVPKKPAALTRAWLESKMRGVAYKKTASAYLFTKVA